MDANRDSLRRPGDAPAAAPRSGDRPDEPDFCRLFEAAPGLYLVLRNDPPHYHIVAASNAYLSATLTRREEIVGKGLFEVFPDNPDNPAADGVRNLRASLERAVASREPDTFSVQKYDIPRPDGTGFEERFWSPVNQPVFEADGSIRFLIHRVEDVTEFVRMKQHGTEQSRLAENLRARANRMEAEILARSQQLQESNDQLRAANRRLDELDRAKTTFFNNVSHEFRTPLTLILGPLEEALRQGRGLDGSTVISVHRNALRLLQLVNNLLDLARLESGRFELHFAPVDIASLTTDIAGNFRGLIEQGGLTLQVDCATLPAPVYVDPDQWERILFNLLSNAFKFTLQGSITVRLLPDGEFVKLEVIDTGTGIPAAEMPRLFERFHRIPGHKGRHFEGTGIGLALVKDLIALHNGTIEVDSAEGKGSTFRVRIPLGTQHLCQEQRATATPARLQPALLQPALPAPAVWTPAEQESSTPGDDDAGKPLLLVVDDNADMRDFLLRLLRPHWRVESAVDGREALAIMRTRPPDLVLSDVMMPNLDGVGLLQAMRLDEALATIPVILLSARAGEEDRVAGLDTGADDYLVKPFSSRELISRVRTHLEMARIRRRATESAALLAETRAALLVDIERKNRELAAFSYSVSHDLRAPLRSIDGFSQALAEDYGDRLDAQGLDYLGRVRAATQRMATLIDDLLHLARIERSEMIPVPLDLTRLAREILTDLARQEPARRVDVRVEDGMTAIGDPPLVRVALENLLGNAWKFTARTSSPVITMGRESAGGETVFCIRDNGAGFDMTCADQLFQPFRRLHTMEEFPGTGIGLATVQRIVERHGGHISAEGNPGSGAAFRFTLHSGTTEKIA